MTMTDTSPPPSPSSLKPTEIPDTSITDSTAVSVPQLSHPTLPQSAINKSLYYHFPTPPQSPLSPALSPTSPRVTSPLTPSSRRPKHARNISRNTSATSTHTRRRSSLSTSFHISQLTEAEYGPPPHPAPTTPLPPIPGAPRVPFTTPAQERNRYSSYELYDKLALLNKQQIEATRKKRHSAPALKTQLSAPQPTLQSADIRRTTSDTAAGNLHRDTTPVSGRRRPSIGYSLANRRSSIEMDGVL
jgi:hypothetical protein